MSDIINTVKAVYMFSEMSPISHMPNRDAAELLVRGLRRLGNDRAGEIIDLMQVINKELNDADE